MPRPTASTSNPPIPSGQKSGDLDLHSPRRPPVRRSPVADTLAVATILALANFVFSRGDPCWLHANPTPLLLLPLLIGGRYGFSAGLITGLLTSATVLGVMSLVGIPPTQVLATNALALISFPVIGLICGEIHGYFNARNRNLSESCEQLAADQRRTRADLELYADANSALQQRLAIHGVRLTSLDSELRRLLAPSTDDLYTDSLALLNRVTGITEAAIYTVDGHDLQRTALLGNGDELPESLRSDLVEIIDQALEERQMVTCRELWGATPQLSARHLAAIPWLDPNGEVGEILLVRRLPFHSVTWQHFAQIETICSWISVYAPLRAAPDRQAGADIYERTLALCINTHQRHALPSSAIHFLATGELRVTQQKLQDAIAPLLRPTDLATSFDLERPNLAVLLPMGGRGEAERLIEQVGSDLSIEFESNLTQTEDLDSTESFMRRLRSHT